MKRLIEAKATPNGMLGYLIGRIVVVSGTIMLTVVCLLLAGLAPFGGLALGRAETWLTLAWVLALGLLATLPIGAVLGSLFRSVRGAPAVMLGNLVLIGVSGIFDPITELPTGCSGSGRSSRCTGSGSACVRRCCRAILQRWRSGTRGGIWRRPACWLPGRSPGWFLPRSCCAGSHAARPDRT
jgi:ABC-2 type transport system permease protein